MSRSSARSLLRLLTTLLAALSLGVLLVSPTASAASDSALRAETVVVIEGFSFVPQSVTVNAGDTVRWINNDNTEHTTTSDGPGWDSGTLTPGTSFTHVFATRGAFTYHCAIHPEMTGTVTVR